MPAVGALYPKIFAERGYWWWKAQEISYALRPTYDTLKSVQRKYKDSLYNMAVFQLRRTDKVQGCAVVYGTVFLTDTLLLLCWFLKVKIVKSSADEKLVLRNFHISSRHWRGSEKEFQERYKL